MATEEEFGKPAGGDLRQGNITLPVLFAREDQQLRSLIESVHEAILKMKKWHIIIKEIKASGAIEKSIEISDRYLKKALAELKGITSTKREKLYLNCEKYR